MPLKQRNQTEWLKKLMSLQNSLVCIYPTPPPWAGCDKGSVFKQSKVGLNLEFSFS